MNEATFTLRDIKLAALDALGDMTCSGPEDFFSRFAGMQVLIESLQSTIPDGVPEPGEPVQEPQKKRKPSKATAPRPNASCMPDFWSVVRKAF
jgi:hypothetical protein